MSWSRETGTTCPQCRRVVRTGAAAVATLPSSCMARGTAVQVCSHICGVRLERKVALRLAEAAHATPRPLSEPQRG
jgi:hypothetical protein